ncbi:hypothetical protein CDV36_010111 [Fusarium kuroshium]|uniref:Phosphoinositide phospholipase C n=1 Tax=Fusarium kuroshium TaxID=2010991 RepID=A0A3M2RY97_9HYPO|nr:hypothetical protein CDV36_010111 [Fusarium kuroshium]
MDLLDLTAAELSQQCLDLFDRCLASRSLTQDIGKDQPSKDQPEAPSAGERLDYKLADFNLWIDGIGALASSKASLDWRLNERPIDLALVKGNLVMLYQSLEDYADLQDKHQALEEAILDIEAALGSLASLALAVRRTGKRSRLHKADRLFNEGEHSELKQHLECIAVLRPTEKGYSSRRFKQKLEVLTPVQQRLVTANLRRRNRFLQARRHSTGLKRRNPELSSVSEDPVNQAHQPVFSPNLEIPIPAPSVIEQPLKLLKNSDAPTISGTSASVPESKLRYTDPSLKKPEVSTARTEVTRITATAHYPRPQLADDNQHMFQCPCCYQTMPVQEVKTNARWRIRKVFNLGTAQQDLQDETDPPPPLYRAAVDLFTRLKDQEETLSIMTFNAFLRQQRPSGHEYDEVFSIKETYGFAAFYNAWVDLGTSAQGPLPPKDLSMPLAHYFISSSYNTYISGNRTFVASRGSAEIYRDILMQGCRYVEIDVWNGYPIEPETKNSSLGQQLNALASKVSKWPKAGERGEPGEPVVTYDQTVATRSGFREVCAVIGTSAFVNNDLPVIVSLEVHADAGQQEVMVRIMKEEWGELLLDEPLEAYDPRFRLPTLGDLRRRILVKVKRSPAILTENDSPSNSEIWIQALSSVGDSSTKTNPSKVVICHALSELGVYTQSEAFRSLDTPAARRPAHIFSLSERSLLELNRSDRLRLLRHNKHYLMRCFPSGSRVDSSNLDPTLFWRLGVQMVGMNWQHLDEGMMLHHGMFTDEDGWVLKPTGYRSADETRYDAIPAGYRDINITIFSGFDIPDDAEDGQGNIGGDKRVLRPQVKVELHCPRYGSDESLYKFSTKTGKTKNPRFGATGSTASFLAKWEPPELSFVRFKVVDDQKSSYFQPLLGWACIRLDRLREGYRLIELFDAEGHPTSGLLLISYSNKERGFRMEIS